MQSITLYSMLLTLSFITCAYATEADIFDPGHDVNDHVGGPGFFTDPVDRLSFFKYQASKLSERKQLMAKILLYSVAPNRAAVATSFDRPIGDLVKKVQKAMAIQFGKAATEKEKATFEAKFEKFAENAKKLLNLWF